MSQGWISLNRQIKDNWIWDDKPYAKGQAWIDILLRVNHKSNKVSIGNQVIDLEDGQTIWSVKDMAEAWGWSRKKVSNFLDVLETDSMLAQKRTSKYTMLTVVNWEFYQDHESQKNIKRTSKEHQKNTNNNDNNENNENNKDTTGKKCKHEDIFEFWNNQAPHKHKEVTKSILEVFNKLALKESENVKLAISRYVKAYNNSEYYYSYAWTLDKFIKQSNGYKEWLDDGRMWVDYSSRYAVKEKVTPKIFINPSRQKVMESENQ